MLSSPAGLNPHVIRPPAKGQEDYEESTTSTSVTTATSGSGDECSEGDKSI